MSEDNLPVPAQKRNPVVKAENGAVFADSRDVAAFFEREHKSVLRSIRDLECSQDFHRRNFAPAQNKDFSGASVSHVEMTRDGFMFLAMGFTGAKAAKWKEDYIAAFNAMEAELKNAPKSFDWMRAVVDTMEANNQRLFTVEKAVENFGAHEDYRSIKAHAAIIGYRLKDKESGVLGRAATALSHSLSSKIGSQPDETYGQVNTYHRDILDKVFAK